MRAGRGHFKYFSAAGSECHGAGDRYPVAQSPVARAQRAKGAAKRDPFDGGPAEKMMHIYRRTRKASAPQTRAFEPLDESGESDTLLKHALERGLRCLLTSLSSTFS